MCNLTVQVTYILWYIFNKYHFHSSACIDTDSCDMGHMDTKYVHQSLSYHKSAKESVAWILEKVRACVHRIERQCTYLDKELGNTWFSGRVTGIWHYVQGNLRKDLVMLSSVSKMDINI